jgi:hypothetical protein
MQKINDKLKKILKIKNKLLTMQYFNFKVSKLSLLRSQLGFP